MKPRQRTPKKGDSVYIDGYWVTQLLWNSVSCTHEPKEVWIKAERTRVNGRIINVDYEDQEVTIRWIDHPHADPEESLITYMDFATLYGTWSTERECYVIQDSDV